VGYVHGESLGSSPETADPSTAPNPWLANDPAPLGMTRMEG
jgi:hypothetical protein